jgi:putative colanic acid biosynthesis acetyltransferase WcaF
MTLVPEAAVTEAASPLRGAPTFSLRHRLLRIGWKLVWTVLARWTPPPAHAWRGFLLRSCGADLARSARVYNDVTVWWPPHLSMGEHASLGPGVNCYNVATIRLEPFAIVSQRAHLCSGTHDCDDAAFPLRARTITIGAHAWVAAEAFVGPGVEVGEGAVLGARGVAMRDLVAWTIYGGNPAAALRARRRGGAL